MNNALNNHISKTQTKQKGYKPYTQPLKRKETLDPSKSEKQKEEELKNIMNKAWNKVEEKDHKRAKSVSNQSGKKKKQCHQAQAESVVKAKPDMNNYASAAQF